MEKRWQNCAVMVIAQRADMSHSDEAVANGIEEAPGRLRAACRDRDDSTQDDQDPMSWNVTGPSSIRSCLPKSNTRSFSRTIEWSPSVRAIGTPSHDKNGSPEGAKGWQSGQVAKAKRMPHNLTLCTKKRRAASKIANCRRQRVSSTRNVSTASLTREGVWMLQAISDARRTVGCSGSALAQRLTVGDLFFFFFFRRRGIRRPRMPQCYARPDRPRIGTRGRGDPPRIHKMPGDEDDDGVESSAADHLGLTMLFQPADGHRPSHGRRPRGTEVANAAARPQRATI